jgi:hypothetical protein
MGYWYPFDEEASSTLHVQSSSARLAGKGRSTAEKNIGIDVLRKYFSGSLKDAAKSLGGECPLPP